MEILKSEQYVGEKLNIKPVTKERLSDFFKEPNVDEKVREFIDEYNLKWNHRTKCYDCDGDVWVNENIVGNDKKLKIKFGYVKGNFVVDTKAKLKTLEGSPQEVVGFFMCADNIIESLKGSPQKVGSHFQCSNNFLTSLRGAPQEVGGNFSCQNNYELMSLRGSPQKIAGDFDCSYNKLLSLNGAPFKVGGNFICKGNKYENIFPNEKPSWVKGEFITK